jgi:hypothetical protein
LSIAEQLAGSATLGVSFAALLFAGVWIGQWLLSGRPALGKVATCVALGGAAVGLGLMYLASRLPGDLWTHFYFLGVEKLTAYFLWLPLLIGSQAIALVLWFIAWRKQRS